MRLTVSMLLLFAGQALAQNHNLTVIENWKSNVWPYERCGSPGMVACIGGCADVPHIAVRSGVCNMPAPRARHRWAVSAGPPRLHISGDERSAPEERLVHHRPAARAARGGDEPPFGKNGWTGTFRTPVSPWIRFPCRWPWCPPAMRPTTAPNSLGAFRLLYEPGYITDSLTMPLFPGLGNHDLSTCDNGGCRDRMLNHTSDAATCRA